MSRSFNASRWKRPHRSDEHKRARRAVNQTLHLQRSLAPEPWLEVLADRCEERGLSTQAESLRQGAELLLPVAPHGPNTRLRW
ncbi:MAG: hypothetical protein Q8S33_10805 [Myxococcales bacterium]|nr:hypothetical protein [Myxococcales bacterium]